MLTKKLQVTLSKDELTHFLKDLNFYIATQKSEREEKSYTGHANEQSIMLRPIPDSLRSNSIQFFEIKGSISPTLPEDSVQVDFLLQPITSTLYLAVVLPIAPSIILLCIAFFHLGGSSPTIIGLPLLYLPFMWPLIIFGFYYFIYRADKWKITHILKTICNERGYKFIENEVSIN